MKAKLIFPAIIIVTLAMSSFFLPKAEKLDIKTKIYCDHCGVCETCKPLLVTVFENTAGVVSAELDIQKEILTVWYNPKKTTSETLRKVVTMAGYAADDLPPNPDAYNKLDECCKKVE
jgi:hypothetical protein